MSCAAVEPLLELTPLLVLDDAAGEALLTQDERDTVEEHLAACARCRARAERASEAYGLLAEAWEESMEPLSPELKERVLEAARAEAAVGGDKKGAAPAAPTADRDAVEAVRGRVVLSCSFCHDRMQREESVFCASCLAPHHHDCFAEHAGCSIPGCDETRTVRPAQLEERRPRRPRRGRRGLLLLLAGAGIAAGGAVAALAPNRPARVSTTPAPPPVSAPAPEARLEVSGDAELIDLSAVDAPLSEVCRAIARQGGLNVVLDPAVSKGQKVRVVSNDIPPRDAVEMVADLTSCEVTPLAGGVLLLEHPRQVSLQLPGPIDIRTAFKAVTAYSGTNVVVDPRVRGSVGATNLQNIPWRDAVLSLAGSVGAHVAFLGEVAVVTGGALPPTALTPVALALAAPSNRPGPATGERLISIDVDAVDLSEVCQSVGRQVGADVRVEEGLDATVSCDLRDVGWRDALRVLARLTGCVVTTPQPGVLRLARPPQAVIEANDCPALALYSVLAAHAGKSVVGDAGVAGEVTLELRHLPYLDALRLVALANGHEVDETGKDMLAVRPAPWAASWGPLPTPVRGERRAQDAALERLLDEIADLVRSGRTNEVQAKLSEVLALAFGSEPAEPARDDAAIAAARGEVDAVMGEVGAAARAGDVDAVLPLLSKLGAAITAYGAVTPQEEVFGQIEAWLAELEPLGERSLALRLKLYSQLGNAHLLVMADAISDELHQEALAAHERLEALAARMEAQEQELFRRNAEALRMRGQALAGRARTLDAIAKLGLDLDALVHVREEGAPLASCAIVNGRRVKEGDPVLDAAGRSIPDVRLLEVLPPTARFELGDTQFVRELGR